MFKLCIALCVVATFATEAPVISLELDSSIRKLNIRSHYQAEKKAKATGLGYTHECPANNRKSESNCKLPRASAFDHHDTLRKSDIKRTVMRVEMGPKGGRSTTCRRKCVCKDDEYRRRKCDKFIDFKNRGTYAVDYKLVDKSGNPAEPVVFAVILDDKTAPSFSFSKVARKFTQECRKSRMTIPMPYVYDNVDTPRQIRSTLRIDGQRSRWQYLRSYKKYTNYRYTIRDFAGIFGKNPRASGNSAATVRRFTVKDTLRPTIKSPTIKAVECRHKKFFKVPTTTCSDKCDDTKDVGVCVGSARRSIRIAGKYTYFASGKATGCEYRKHYLYDYRGSDCVWVSNKHHLKHGHAYQNAYLKFQMLEYGNLEDDDYLLIQLKFYGSKGTSTGWIDTVKLRDDVLGWVWTTVYDGPGYGYFSHKGKVNKDWRTFHAAMERNHHYVQIKVTLHSNHDYHERHVVDNLEVFGTECTDYIPAVRTTRTKITYTCKDKAKHSASKVSKTVSIVDRTPPTIKVNLAYNTYKSQGTWKGKIFTHHGGHTYRGFAPHGRTRDQRTVFSCADTCCKTKDIKESHRWVKSCRRHTRSAKWNELVPGTYYHKFVCTDCNKRVTHGCRTIINVDKHVPIITVLGGKSVYDRRRKGLQKKNIAEATHDKNYVDGGATCSDMVDGVISKEVEVSGDVVNMARVGVYHITYKCCDIAGNCARPAIRDVHVVDNTCPSCKVRAKRVNHEASFLYTDAPNTCSDSLDGNKKVIITPTKKKKVDTEVTGCYYLTYSAVDKQGNTNTGKCPTCPRRTSCKGKQGKQIRTVCVKDTLKPVIALHFKGKKIHESRARDTGVNGQRNPAQDKWMAETSVNGWIIGAVASAVAGVALMAVASKKTSASVPV